MTNNRSLNIVALTDFRLRETTAVRLILADERLYGGSPPHWFEGRRQRPCETAAQAKAERRRRVKRLRRFGKKNADALLVADRLDACQPEARCLSGACPECARAWQRWFVTATAGFLSQQSDGVTGSTILSPIHARGLVPHGELGL
jgi:hypothetical protein